ncbi:MAG: methylenetetrahydrofolate--tRNA-(uracil(54)-C(5))-methyltransferase (FADH(2)-oxidizing) TrmFO [Oligoflexia bacterium]|nr:methylenetetrahydrofolate--tRNA-(uracil(54)-C(5))-methyltransferase (FADH(2)-oxidizing) TrmFO [Oligoflexia bacterium]
MAASTKPIIHIVGGGLAGSECALQLAGLGYFVKLYEMRPKTLTPAHHTGQFAELVCSNSLGSLTEPSAPGLLKWEMSRLGSKILDAALRHRVPAGQSLSVDRNEFSNEISNLIRKNDHIEVIEGIVEDLDQLPRPAVIATGPLTHEKLAQSIRQHFGTEDHLYFYDAIAPVIDADSINMDICFKASRYDKGGDDYINCPLNKDEYFAFVEAVIKSEKVEPKEFENTQYFESCLPIEVMVSRGPLTLAYGPMKPVGLRDPRTGKTPFACVQLRQENKFATAYNLVGFQTKMKYPEQMRVFRMIPGLEKAEFLKLGSLHRNMFINSPILLNKNLSSKKDPNLFFAGQITGVEGYFESTCTGMLVSKFIDAQVTQRPLPIFAAETALGALLGAITEPKTNFQPTNINWGLFPPLVNVHKSQKKQALFSRAQERFQTL